MKNYTFQINGETYTPSYPFSKETAEKHAKALVESKKGDCRLFPCGEEGNAMTIHYMVDCPTCNGKGKTGNPAFEDTMVICTQCNGNKKVMTSKINIDGKGNGN